MTPTVPVSSPCRSGEPIPGTIGFELYLVCLGVLGALRPARLPSGLEVTHGS